MVERNKKQASWLTRLITFIDTVLSIFYAYSDRCIVAGGEALKRIVTELFFFGDGLLDGLSAGILHILLPGGYYRRKARILKDEEIQIEDEDSVVINSKPKYPSPLGSPRLRTKSAPGSPGTRPRSPHYSVFAARRSLLDQGIKQAALVAQREEKGGQEIAAGRRSAFDLQRRDFLYILMRACARPITFFVPALSARTKYRQLKKRSNGTSSKTDEQLKSKESEADLELPDLENENYLAERVFSHELMGTGVVEDLEAAVLSSIDKYSSHARSFLESVLDSEQAGKVMQFALRHPLRSSASAFSLPLRLLRKARRVRRADLVSWLRTENADVRSVGQIVKDAGYPFEETKVETDDGYLLYMQRLPRKDKHKVVILVTGIADSSFTFVNREPIGGLAYTAFDADQDVFLANFRGAFDDPAHVNLENMTKSEYWRFTINDHAFSDMPSFIRYIRQVKQKELGSLEGVDITVIGHSMGCAVTLMHIIESNLNHKPHHIDRAILLAPAGLHYHLSRFLEFLLPVFENTVAKALVSFKISSRYLRMLLAKLLVDIDRMPATLDLLSVLIAQLVGGYAKRFPAKAVPNITSYLIPGTSRLVFLHAVQWYKTKRFQAFDFGPERNVKEYGSPAPRDYLEHFDQIDIPTHFVFGDRDLVITPDAVKTQYQTFIRQNRHPELARLKELLGYGHADFTYGGADELTDYIVLALNDKV